MKVIEACPAKFVVGRNNKPLKAALIWASEPSNVTEESLTPVPLIIVTPDVVPSVTVPLTAVMVTSSKVSVGVVVASWSVIVTGWPLDAENCNATFSCVETGVWTCTIGGWFTLMTLTETVP